MSTNNTSAQIFNGSFLSNSESEIKIELPFKCETLNKSSNGPINFIQNMIISTWGSYDCNTTFSCSYHLLLNSYTLQEDYEGKDVYQATINNLSINTSTDLFYISPSRNNVGIEIYPKYNIHGLHE